MIWRTYFSKLEEDERAVFQMVVNPRSDEGWRKRQNENRKNISNEKRIFSFRCFRIFLFGRHHYDYFSIIIPGGEDRFGGSNAPGADSGDHYIRMVQSKEEVAKRMGEKKPGQVGFDVAIRVGCGENMATS